MEILSNNEKLNFGSAVCLGNFDGVHIGHQKIIETLLTAAKEYDLKTVMLTFKIHPENYLQNNIKTKLITSESVKFRILSQIGIDYLYLHEFDEHTKNLSPDAFVKGILSEKLNAKTLVAGFNYRFGRNRAGSVKTLIDAGNKYGIKVIIVPAVYDNKRIVSSTLIRNHLSLGDMEQVNRMLNRHYAIEGIVQGGKKKGREIGFPTANLLPVSELRYPKRGVYITKTFFDGNAMISVTNIGTNPTVGGGITVIETHIIEYFPELYNKEIRIEFYKKIRDEKTFDSVGDLRDQIKNDIQYTIDYFNKEA
jgi:riboflavin kinase / FMN adenylyltransferase